MTKKSPARLLRDAEKKEQDAKFATNTVWTDLNVFGQEALEVIKTNAQLAGQLAQPGLDEFYDNAKTVNINMQTLASDLKRVTETYADIAIKHADKSGKAQTYEDMTAAFAISGEYAALIEDVSNTVLPISTMLAEAVGVAVDRRNAAQTTVVETGNLTPEQNPNEITDVVAREV